MAAESKVISASPSSVRGGGRGVLRASYCFSLTLALLGGLSSGCVTMWGGTRGPEEARKDGLCKVIVRWQTELGYAPDTTKGGQLTPGLVGRVYLYNQKMDYPLDGDGSLHVELADASVKPPKPLEQWNIDAATCQRMMRKDFVGQGYSVFLPWATFQPEIKAVQLKLAYQPKQGPRLFATPEVVALNQSGMPPVETGFRSHLPFPKAEPAPQR